MHFSFPFTIILMHTLLHPNSLFIMLVIILCGYLIFTSRIVSRQSIIWPVPRSVSFVSVNQYTVCLFALLLDDYLRNYLITVPAKNQINNFKKSQTSSHRLTKYQLFQRASNQPPAFESSHSLIGKQFSRSY